MIKWCQTVWRDFHSTVHHIPPWSHSFNYSLSRRTPTETSWKSVKKCFIKYFKKKLPFVIATHKTSSYLVPSHFAFTWNPIDLDFRMTFLISPFTFHTITWHGNCLLSMFCSVFDEDTLAWIGLQHFSFLSFQAQFCHREIV